MPDSSKLRVLVADDDADVRCVVGAALEVEGMVVDHAADGAEALRLARHGGYDAFILDVVMPRGSGIELLRQLRSAADVPVLMLSGWDNEAMRIVAYEAGADDYVAKPVTARELVLRVRAATRRYHVEPRRAPLGGDGLSIDAAGRRVLVDGVEIELTAKEFDLLAHLAAAPGRVFTRAELLRSVWASRPDWQNVDTVTEHVYRLRQKLEPDSSRPHWIETVRGAGYRFRAAS